MSNRKKPGSANKKRRKKILDNMRWGDLERDDAIDARWINRLVVKAVSGLNSTHRKLVMESTRRFTTPLEDELVRALEDARSAIYAQQHALYVMSKFILQPGAAKRWTDEETEKAVYMRAEGVSLEFIALELNRSVQAVAQRISQAVGIQQLEVQIKGRIEGVLDHEYAEGAFTGTLIKEKKHV